MWDFEWLTTNEIEILHFRNNMQMHHRPTNQIAIFCILLHSQTSASSSSSSTKLSKYENYQPSTEKVGHHNRCTPMDDVLKFNVDGSSRGKPGPSGIGGVLRDSCGKVLCLFSFFIGVLNSNVAELMAIKKAVELVWSMPHLRGRDILVVSDSKVAVAWVNNGDFGNFAHVQKVFDIRSILAKAGSIKISFDLRIYNSFADSLAKMGSNNNGDFVVWGDL